MKVISNPNDITTVSDPWLADLIRQRISTLADTIPFESSIHGYFLILESGDTLQAIECQIGFDILANRWTGLRFGDSGFTPACEVIEDLGCWYSMLFVLDDSGYGVEVFVPKAGDIPSDLLALCAQYALPVSA